MNKKTTIITCQKNWMEHNALVQLERVAELPGVVRAVGMPDLHAGKTPVGITVEVEGRIYPHLIGNDIGCGMSLFATGIHLKKYKQDRWVTRLNYIRKLEDLVSENPYQEESPIFDLGTLGGGNHFAEFQRVERIYEQQQWNALAGEAPEEQQVFLLVHCGSRGYGQRIVKKFEQFGGYEEGSQEAQEYCRLHDHALLWAGRNRKMVAEKLIDRLGFDVQPDCLLQSNHNFLEQKDGLWIHRKGSQSALCGPVLIPGSRGSLTYLVMPSKDTEKAAYSLAHGAGRKWARSLCKGRIREKYDRDTIRQTKLSSRVVCHDTELLFEEAPEAYKNIEQIIESLQEHNLIEIIATLRPLITYKG